MRVHATPLPAQPALDQYAGRYERPPVTSYELRVEGGVLRSGKSPGSSYVFYGPDVAYVASEDGTGGNYVGMPVEFIRNAAGAVSWIRVNGRIGRKA
jgi:hypothetical protein